MRTEKDDSQKNNQELEKYHECYTIKRAHRRLIRGLDEFKTYKGTPLRQKCPKIDYLCNTELAEILTIVMEYVVSYLVSYHKSIKVPIFRQELMRPLSVILFGPSGVGKTRFVDVVGEYLDNVFGVVKKEPFAPVMANISEFERLESLGQILIGLRNKKIDANYPPLLFIDEADAEPATFSRLLTMLWDGKFFWGEHRRDLGSMVIFLAASGVRCEWQFKALIEPKKAEEDLRKVERANPKADWKEADWNNVKEALKAGKHNNECKGCVPTLSCGLISRLKEKKEWIGNSSGGKRLLYENLWRAKQVLETEELWQKKGSDFLSRVNGPIVFLPDLTSKLGHRVQLFEFMVNKHLEKLGLDTNKLNVTSSEELLDQLGTPRYSVRSLQLLAESLDPIAATKGTLEFGLEREQQLLSIHFPSASNQKKSR